MQWPGSRAVIGNSLSCLRQMASDSYWQKGYHVFVTILGSEGTLGRDDLGFHDPDAPRKTSCICAFRKSLHVLLHPHHYRKTASRKSADVGRGDRNTSEPSVSRAFRHKKKTHITNTIAHSRKPLIPPSNPACRRYELVLGRGQTKGRARWPRVRGT